MTGPHASGDLDQAVVAADLGDRPVQAYPALLSTEPLAMAWARQGGQAGAVVVADYQAAPRGRGGWPWAVQPGLGLGFTLLLRPELPPEREGWPYVPCLLGLLDVIGTPESRLLWPDAVVDASGAVLARLGVYVELGPGRTEWATATVLVEQAAPPRGPLLSTLAQAVERRVEQPPEQVLADYLPRCATLGRPQWARLIPLGPGGPSVTGEAVDVLPDGALVLLTERGNRVAIPPQNLGLLQDPEGPVEAPERVLGQFRT
jgi:BirA family biotin operon repressor/biotin-[acetyl-CoA-carboxylase] ligase